VTVTAIVLAGGQSNRFGVSKLGAQLGEMTLLEHAIEAAAAVATQVIVAGPRPADAPPPRFGGREVGSEVRYVADESPFDGPLAALRGVLRIVDTELAIVVGGDMPSLVPAVLDSMVAALRSDPVLAAITLAATGPKRQVLPVALRVEPASAAAAVLLDAGDRSLFGLVTSLRNGEIPAWEWRTVDPRGVTLLDVDEPADLERVQKELR
jgi:molybdopterin-guanine dinucleotide biosynthesis protein A